MTPNVHVHLTVRDLAASRAFYERFFGVPPVKVRDGYLKFLPPLAPLNLAMSEGDGGSGGHVSHLGIQVDSAEVVTRELARVRAAGLPVRVEEDVDCCHANQTKFWVADPDGTDWEVYVLNHDLPAPESAETPVAAATGCCGGGGCGTR